MGTPKPSSSDIPIKIEDSQTISNEIDHAGLQTENDGQLVSDEMLKSLQASYADALRSESKSGEEKPVLVQRQQDESLRKNALPAKELNKRNNLLNEVGVSSRDKEEEELSREVDDQGMRENEEAKIELDANYNDEIDQGNMLSEKMSYNRVLLESSEAIKPIKESLARIIQKLGEIKVGSTDYERMDYRSDREPRAVVMELLAVSKLANEVEVKMNLYQDIMKKKKKELETSLMSLAAENHDISSLLRIALVEKEAIENNLNRLNENREQKGVVMKIAERGLQMVGFGFMRGAGANETPSASNVSSPRTSPKSEDGSECKEEDVGLTSTMERIIKNLRLENTQLKRSLEDSRSDSERLQSLAEKQARKLAENTSYIKELEDREIQLSQNVEELSMEIKEAEEEIGRWREACELEVEAGKNVAEECDRMVAIFKQELEKTKAALNVSNGKLKLKDELAGAAMAAQAAAERSLYLADHRTMELHTRVEELTRQLDEAEKRGRDRRHRVRHICWPWRVLKFNPANSTTTTVHTVKRMLPEMQAFLP